MRFIYLRVSFICRPGSVIADFVIYFEQTANETMLPAAAKVLNESITDSQNVSRLGDLQIDSSSVVVAGEKYSFSVSSFPPSQFPSVYSRRKVLMKTKLHFHLFPEE